MPEIRFRKPAAGRESAWRRFIKIADCGKKVAFSPSQYLAKADKHS
jgi:hypothetical protein